MKRLMLAGTGSGCGKTTVALLLMTHLQQMGLRIAPYKAGPDYIDPAFHEKICGRPGCNLDLFLMQRDDVLRMLDADADLGLIEGVMGYYDGFRVSDFAGSCYRLAEETDTPVILLCDASGSAASVAATVRGFNTLVERSQIAGVLVNRVSGERHYMRVKEAVEMYAGLPCVGYIPKTAALHLESRHLGLVQAQETEELEERIREAAKGLAETIDAGLLLSLAKEKLPAYEHKAQMKPTDHFRVGVARDEAFSFIYEANLSAIREAGGETVFFSPMQDERLPEGLDALWLSGGYPEVFAERLEENRSMRESIRAALENDMPCYAECGGLLYLTRAIEGHEMVGFVPAVTKMTDRLQRFGYVYVQDSGGLCFPAHEFHYAHLDYEQEEPNLTWTVRRASDASQQWRCGYVRKNTTAAFPHVHFTSHPELIARLFHR